MAAISPLNGETIAGPGDRSWPRPDIWPGLGQHKEHFSSPAASSHSTDCGCSRPCSLHDDLPATVSGTGGQSHGVATVKASQRWTQGLQKRCKVLGGIYIDEV